MQRLRLPKPATKTRVVELLHAGPLARFMAKRNWAAFTLPLPFVTIINYWLTYTPRVRQHEYQHCHQRDTVKWFRLKYLWQLIRHGYKANRYEVEAYATHLLPLPDWATPTITYGGTAMG